MGANRSENKIKQPISQKIFHNIEVWIFKSSYTYLEHIKYIILIRKEALISYIFV